ncbi:MAG: hypothetical protein BGO23_01180 [Solirubrobacterales bacterium 67-14]|nr:MAG: hypothetical protein BGO23_01180 [Solirubrobacterales bacterium 67-14]
MPSPNVADARPKAPLFGPTGAFAGPESPWILHSTPVLGHITQRWIDSQVNATDRYDSRILGASVADECTVEDERWIVPRRGSAAWLSYRGMSVTDGFSPLYLAARMRQHRPDVIHVHFAPPAAQLTRFASLLDRPLVTSFYGYDATLNRYRESWLWRRPYMRLFRRASAFVVEGPAMADRVAGLGCPEERIRVVRLPADQQSLGSVVPRKTDEFTVVAAGRFVEKKGFDLAILAFARAFAGRTDAKLILVGGGPLEGAYRQQVAELGIEPQVEWAGRLQHHEFMTRVASAHVAVYPSVTASNGDGEGGAPVTLIEGQWLGVPSIVSAHDDLPFVAAPNGSITLETRSPHSWSDALRSLYEQPAKLEAMGVAAREFARSKHGPEANAVGREEIYDEVSA